jgi:hypothetical protein
VGFLVSDDLNWNRDKVYRKGSTYPLIGIERDSVFPDMWRVRSPDGTLSDIVNRSRCKDAAASIALREANAPIRSKLEGAISPREARTAIKMRKAALPFPVPSPLGGPLKMSGRCPRDPLRGAGGTPAQAGDR